jgi:hypothetical protein
VIDTKSSVRGGQPGPARDGAFSDQRIGGYMPLNSRTALAPIPGDLDATYHRAVARYVRPSACLAVDRTYLDGGDVEVQYLPC